MQPAVDGNLGRGKEVPTETGRLDRALDAVTSFFADMRRPSRRELAIALAGVLALAGCGGEVQSEGPGQIVAEPRPTQTPNIEQNNWIIGSLTKDGFQVSGAYPAYDTLTVWGSSVPEEGAAADILKPTEIGIGRDGQFKSFPKPDVARSFHLHAGVDFNANGAIDPGEEQPITMEEAVLSGNPFALEGSSHVPALSPMEEQAAE